MALASIGSKILNLGQTALLGTNAIKTAQIQQQEARSNSGNENGGGAVTSTTSIMDHNNIYAIQFLSNSYRGKELKIVGYLPENFNVQIGSEYSQPFAELAPSALAQGVGLGLVSGIMGASGSIQAMSVKVWQGSQGLTMSVPMTFVAETDPSENIDKIMELLSLCTPSAPEGLFGPLLPPGPNYGGFDKLMRIGDVLGDAIKTGASEGIEAGFNEAKTRVSGIIREGMQNQISVQMGEYMFFESVVVDNVDADFQNLLAPLSLGGRPWKVDVTVQFSTLWNPSIEDLRKIFRMA